MSNIFSLSGKKILVTGASSGIGKSIAIAISEQGGEVILVGRNLERLQETFDSLDGQGHQLISLDLNDEDKITSMVSGLNKIDGIVHSAGVVKTLPIKFLNRTELRDIMSINFEVPVILTQKLLKAKKINAGGSIIFISSLAGPYIGVKGNGAYSASKGALNGIMKVMCVELASQKIRVNCICPGMVKTPMTENELAAVSKEQLILDEQQYPLGYGNPEDVAYASVYLLSNASKWVSGTSLVLDGGFSISN